MNSEFNELSSQTSTHIITSHRFDSGQWLTVAIHRRTLKTIQVVSTTLQEATEVHGGLVARLSRENASAS